MTAPLLAARCGARWMQGRARGNHVRHQTRGPDTPHSTRASRSRSATARARARAALSPRGWPRHARARPSGACAAWRRRSDPLPPRRLSPQLFSPSGLRASTDGSVRAAPQGSGGRRVRRAAAPELCGVPRRPLQRADGRRRPAQQDELYGGPKGVAFANGAGVPARAARDQLEGRRPRGPPAMAAGRGALRIATPRGRARKRSSGISTPNSDPSVFLGFASSSARNAGSASARSRIRCSASPLLSISSIGNSLPLVDDRPWANVTSARAGFPPRRGCQPCGTLASASMQADAVSSSEPHRNVRGAGGSGTAAAGTLAQPPSGRRRASSQPTAAEIASRWSSRRLGASTGSTRCRARPQRTVGALPIQAPFRSARPGDRRARGPRARAPWKSRSEGRSRRRSTSTSSPPGRTARRCEGSRKRLASPCAPRAQARRSR